MARPLSRGLDLGLVLDRNVLNGLGGLSNGLVLLAVHTVGRRSAGSLTSLLGLEALNLLLGLLNVLQTRR